MVCKVCGNKMPDVSIYKGKRIQAPEVCSEKCFVDYLHSQKGYKPFLFYIYQVCSPTKFASELEELFYFKMRKYFDLKYSPFIFKFPKRKVYVPDFYIPDLNIFIEIKGVRGRISKAMFATKYLDLFIVTPTLMLLWGWCGDR